jgi:hypothetical protein
MHNSGNKVFLRPAKIENNLPTALSVASLLRNSSDQEVIILFPRDTDFIDNSKGEVEFKMIQEGKERKVKFKIKDLAKDPNML